jgi:hypothetical protein
MSPFIGKSLPWQDGYFAQHEGYAHMDGYTLQCPYDVLTQWASNAEWYAGYLFAEENPHLED